MSPDFARQLIGVAFFAVGALAILLLWIVRRSLRAADAPAREKRSRSPRETDLSHRPPVAIESVPDEPVAFGYKIAWLAIRSADTEHVARAVGLRDVRPANWETGLEAAFHGQGVFVSPPVAGWVFVAGIELPQPAPPASPAVWESWIQHISSEFSQVQYFGNHRVSSYHAWARFIDGRECRAFSYCDGTIHIDRGNSAPAEQPWEVAGDNDCVPDEEDVLRVAADWGLNPMSLEDRDYPHGVGLIGRLAP